MDPNQSGSSNPNPQGQAGSQPNQAGQPSGQPSAPKAQSEKGPTTYVEGGVVIQHDEGDAVTKDAYKLGHPSDGIANQKAQNPPPAIRAADQARQQGQSGQQGVQMGQQGGGQPNAGQPPQSGQQGGTQRVEMLRDEGGHGAGQTVELPHDQAQQLINNGAAKAV